MMMIADLFQRVLVFQIDRTNIQNHGHLKNVQVQVQKTIHNSGTISPDRIGCRICSATLALVLFIVAAIVLTHLRRHHHRRRAARVRPPQSSRVRPRINRGNVAAGDQWTYADVSYSFFARKMSSCTPLLVVLFVCPVSISIIFYINL